MSEDPGLRKVLIVDDHESVHLYLRRFLQEHLSDRVQVLGALTGLQAVQLTHTHRPSLVFLDVNLPDISGFDYLNCIENFNTHVVFVSGDPQFATQAFDVDCVDFVLKPLTKKRLLRALARVEQQSGSLPGISIPELRRVFQEQFLTKLMVQSAGGIKLLEVDEALFFESTQKQTLCHHSGGSDYIEQSLLQLERVLSPDRFLRVSRSSLVNLNRVVAVSKTRGTLELDNGEKIGVSLSRKTALKKRLQALSLNAGLDP